MNEEWTLNIAENFKENKKQFWKGGNEVRKKEKSVRNPIGEELTLENDLEVK